MKLSKNTIPCNVVKIAFTPFNSSRTPCLSASLVKALHFLRVHCIHRPFSESSSDKRSLLLCTEELSLMYGRAFSYGCKSLLFQPVQPCPYTYIHVGLRVYTYRGYRYIRVSSHVYTCKTTCLRVKTKRISKENQCIVF